MSHFAKVEDGVVTQVLVVEQEFIDTGALGDASQWVQTSYNTRGGKHYDPNTGEEDSGTPLRKNYAGKGYTYDSARDVFYEPQPYPSWTLDDDTCLWEVPVAYPDDDKRYSWDEDTTSWVEVEIPE
jgi:hypothetical protein